MRRLLLTTLLLFTCLFSVRAQPDAPNRIALNEEQAPFYHGVASGDAQSDKVIIWTRITTEEPSAEVIWRVAKDSFFQNIVSEGTFLTSAARDYTVKVDVTGLEADTWYFYEFEDPQGRLSVRGRTKTTPVNDIENFRAAVVSCASYPHGFFNVYDRITERNDISAVIHLGDYIYEYGLNEYGKNPNRKPEPTNDIVTLADYRTRYSQYHLDTMLQKIHQQYTFYNIWDDHEFANNSWRDGAENHNPSKQGDWSTRKSVALQAYLEWVPIREIDPDNKFKIYRSVKIGNLAEIFFLDTRIIERELETDPDGPNKRLLGEEQMEWLQTSLKNSTAQWKVVAQQVMVAPLLAFGLTLNTDQWDGYTFERKRLFDFINNNNINNVVVLTGDIHTFWANDLPFAKDSYNPLTKSGSAGVEFVTSAVTSPGIPLTIPNNVIRALNPHIRYNRFNNRGFIILDLKKDKAQGDYYTIWTVNQPNTGMDFQLGMYTMDGDNFLNGSHNPSVNMTQNIDHVPRGIRDKTATPVIERPTVGTIIGAYPNPFLDEVGLQYYLTESKNLRLQVIDMTGRVIYEEKLGQKPAGLHYDRINAYSLPSGQYRISLTDGISSIGRNVIKIK